MTRWRLTCRLCAWIVGTTATSMLIAFGVGGLFLSASVTREAEALLQEELDEARLMLSLRDEPRDALDDVARTLAGHHPGTPMAWRLFAADGSTLASHGELRLLSPDYPRAELTSDTITTPHGRMTRTVNGPDGSRLGLVLDVSAVARTVSNYWWLAGALFLLGTGLSFVISRVLTGRIRTLLADVADSVDADRSQVRAATPPIEIAAVLEKIQSQFDRVKNDASQQRLFTAGLAHELRSPIQNLIAQTEVALLKQRDGDSYRELLRSQLDELAELSDAVDNLLSLCTVQAKSGAVPESFDVVAESELRLGRDRARAERKGVVLTIHSAGDTEMRGDREMVLRAIRNVVANAIDWSPPSSAVEMHVAADADTIEVTVDDSGPGVDPNDRERIFKPFVRGAQRAPGRIGYGLGLAMAREASERHGGRIEVTDTPTHGARFRMTFERRAYRSSSNTHA